MDEHPKAFSYVYRIINNIPYLSFRAEGLV